MSKNTFEWLGPNQRSYRLINEPASKSLRLLTAKRDALGNEYWEEMPGSVNREEVTQMIFDAICTAHHRNHLQLWK